MFKVSLQICLLSPNVLNQPTPLNASFGFLALDFMIGPVKIYNGSFGLLEFVRFLV